MAESVGVVGGIFDKYSRFFTVLYDLSPVHAFPSHGKVYSPPRSCLLEQRSLHDRLKCECNVATGHKRAYTLFDRSRTIFVAAKRAGRVDNKFLIARYDA